MLPSKPEDKKLIDEMIENLIETPYDKYLKRYFSIKITQSKTTTIHLVFKKKKKIEDFLNIKRKIDRKCSCFVSVSL